MTTKPNILFITCDQMRWDAMSILGTPGYQTPNLDRLATEGLYCTHAYTPSPVCTPARVSMLNGQYPTTHGAYEIGMVPVPALQGPTMGSLFTEAGYATALIGKTHFVARELELQHVAGDPRPDPEKPLPPESFWHEFDGPYLGFQRIRHASPHTCDRAPDGHYRAWLQDKDVNVDHLHFSKDMSKEERQAFRGRWELDEKLTQNAWIVEESIEFIDEQNDKPWLCWASFQDPHPPFVCPEPWYSSVDMTGVDLGGLRPGEMQDKPPFYQRFIDGKYFTDSDDVHLWDGINVPAQGLYESHPEPSKCIQAYIGMVNMLDAWIGRLIDHLEEKGQLDNTLIVFTTDHGEMLGRHGMWGKGPCAYEDCQRIPLLLWWPSRQQKHGRSDSCMNLVDILPTFLDAAGIEWPPFIQGVSQLPVIDGEVETVNDWALIDFHCTINLHQRVLIHDGFKLVVYRHADYGELYDLREDPDQYKNLFDAPEFAERKCAMLQALARASMAAVGKLPSRAYPC